MRAVILLVVLLVASPAHAYLVGPAIPLDQLAGKVDLIVKATVVSDKPVTDPSFDRVEAYPVNEAELAVISTIKGKPAKTVRFRHYTYKPSNVGIGYSPLAYTLEPGRSYLIFAVAGKGGAFRQFQKPHTQKQRQGVLPAGDDKPHRGTAIVDIAWEELHLLAQRPEPERVLEAIEELDQMSGGGLSKLKDFDRGLVFAELRPLLLAKDDRVASAAIAVFGSDGPYFVERDAPYWLAGIGKGTIDGLSPRKPTTLPGAVTATKELLEVAATWPALKALAIRALGRTRTIPPAQLLAWGKDPDLAVRRAAVLVSAESTDRRLIDLAMADRAYELRATAALAIGFAQDPALIPRLGKLLGDKDGRVGMAAAMSLLSYALDDAAPTLKAHLAGEFGPLFVNALARRDPKPYLTRLAEVIERDQRPAHWWGGSIPSYVSWRLIFDYLKVQPAAELAKHGKLLDVLEHQKWGGSSEPTALYALYVHTKLTARASAFRALIKKTVSWDNDLYFDRADQDPKPYLQ